MYSRREQLRNVIIATFLLWARFVCVCESSPESSCGSSRPRMGRGVGILTSDSGWDKLLPLLNDFPESRYAFFRGFVRHRKAFSLDPKLFFVVSVDAIILRIELFLVSTVICLDEGKLVACQTWDYFDDL